MEKSLQIKYHYPFFKLLFNPKIIMLLIIVNLVILADYLTDYDFNFRLAKFFYILVLIPLIFKALTYTSYYIMLIKTRSIKINKNFLIINNKRIYSWKELEFKLTSYKEFSPASHHAHNAIWINILKKDKVVEEILCYIDGLNLFEINHKHLFKILQNIQKNEIITNNEYKTLLENQKQEDKKSFFYLLLSLILTLTPIILILLFIKY
jgi:hypothetical protein